MTITGTGFAPGVVVTFGSLTAKATVVSGTQIKAVVPNGDAAPSTISVSDAQGSATSASQFTPTCAITGFSPSSGPPATVVTISGIGFTTTATVKFHGVPAASVTFVSSTTLQATVPAHGDDGLDHGDQQARADRDRHERDELHRGITASSSRAGCRPPDLLHEPVVTVGVAEGEEDP